MNGDRSKSKEKEQYICYLCGKVIDGEAFEYIKTKRGTEIRMHRRCVPKGRRNNDAARD